MRSIAIALAVSAALALPAPAAAKSYGDYSTKSKCLRAMDKEQKKYRKKHGRHAMQPLLRCKYSHHRYRLVRV
jgi:hypothetical protein